MNERIPETLQELLGGIELRMKCSLSLTGDRRDRFLTLQQRELSRIQAPLKELMGELKGKVITAIKPSGEPNGECFIDTEDLVKIVKETASNRPIRQENLGLHATKPSMDESTMRALVARYIKAIPTPNTEERAKNLADFKRLQEDPLGIYRTEWEALSTDLSKAFINRETQPQAFRETLFENLEVLFDTAGTDGIFTKDQFPELVFIITEPFLAGITEEAKQEEIQAFIRGFLLLCFFENQEDGSYMFCKKTFSE